MHGCTQFFSCAMTALGKKVQVYGARSTLRAVILIIMSVGVSATSGTFNQGNLVPMDSIVSHLSSQQVNAVTSHNVTAMRKKQLSHIKEPDFVLHVNKMINDMLSGQPVFKLVELKVTKEREIQLRWIDGKTLYPQNIIIDSIPIGYGCVDKNSPKNYIGYRKLYCSKYDRENDQCHRLAAIFINLNKLFPCAGQSARKNIYHAFSYEEDGFMQGKALLEAADNGGNFEIFGKDVNTYGITIQDCPLMFGYSGCLPGGFSKVIVAALPRSCFCT